MKIAVVDQQDDLAIDPASVRTVVKRVLSDEGQSTNEVTVHFVSTQEICRLHASFFGDPSPTDCISFPMDSSTDGGYHVLGEVFICPSTAIDYVGADGDIYEETTLYLVHALLHLLGYDDQEPKERREMHATQKWHMNNLRENDLFLSED